MSGIRKQSIYSSILVYIGVGIGAINTYFFVKNGSFSPQEYALTRLFFDIGQNFYILASLGAIPVLYKFYPYYKDNLHDKQNDLLTRSLIVAFIGFILVAIAGYIFEPLVVRKFSERSALLVDHYHWIFVFAFGLLFFSVLEGYTWALQKTIVSNFLRETGLRMITFVFIILFYFKYIDFHQFMLLFSTLYIILTLCLLFYLIGKGKFIITFKASRVTKKLRKKMLGMQSLIFGGIVVQTIGQTIAGIIIASLKGMTQTAVFSLALYAANLVQIPQRSIQSIATGVLVRAWKNKNYAEISRIYQRSCINMLLLSVFIFGNIWLNARDGFNVLNIQNDYAAGLQVILVIGILRIIDAGTGVNATVIAASNFWKFEFFTGVILLLLPIPLTYIFVKEFGIIGSAYSELIAFTIYNAIRFEFIRRKFHMQPFNVKTVYALLLGVLAFFLTYFLFNNLHGWIAIILRSILFSTIIIAGTFALRLTPDAHQLYDIGKQRIKRK
ncbi:MAG: polysaccharide biosynthesis C-terminal domain-containing protein [Parafilimonas sp.]